MSYKKLKKLKKKKKQLPDRIIPIENKDKAGFTEYWYEGRNKLNPVAPWRMILAARPSCGKTCVILNMLARADPEFDEVYLVHTDDTTEEYDDVELAWKSTELPPLEMFRNSRDIKKILIIEDVDLSSMSKSQRHILDRLFGNVSSHENLSIALTAQDFSNIPLCARRTSNCFIIYRQPDLMGLAIMASRTGNSQEKWQHLMKHLRSVHDFLFLDMTKNTPYPIRLNGFQLIDSETGDLI
jgi:hypothetical protein